MRSTNPLARTILMDYVNKKNRGKWSTVEGFASGLFASTRWSIISQVNVVAGDSFKVYN